MKRRRQANSVGRNDKTDREVENRPPRGTRAFWAGSVEEFLATRPATVVAELAQRVSREHSGIEALQMAAWDAQMPILGNTS